MWRTIKIDVQVGELTLPKILQSEKSFADTSGEWNLILVDRNHYIPNNYQVELTELSNGKKVDSRIYPELQQMFNDARAEGLALFVREGYRTTEEQQKISNEPWHYRYVGTTVAKIMKEENLCLEEYLEKYK